MADLGNRATRQTVHGLWRKPRLGIHRSDRNRVESRVRPQTATNLARSLVPSTGHRADPPKDPKESSTCCQGLRTLGEPRGAVPISAAACDRARNILPLREVSSACAVRDEDTQRPGPEEVRSRPERRQSGRGPEADPSDRGQACRKTFPGVCCTTPWPHSRAISPDPNQKQPEISSMLFSPKYTA